MMMPSLQSWGLTPASRLSPALRQSIQTRWATATGYCSFFLRTGSSLLNKDSTSTAIFCASSPQQMRFTTACLETRGAAESSSTSSRRAPPNATTLVKQLRERTAVSIGMCKRALEESNWDEEEAVVYLRKAGVARASLAANRDAAAGVVAVYRSTDGTQCTAVVLSCETDFVQKNPKFVAFSQALAEHCYATLRSSDTGLSDALGSLLVNQLKSSRASPTLSSCVQSGSTASADSVSELLADLTTQFGETVEVKAVVSLDSNASSCIGVYVHNETTPGAGVGSAAAVVELSWVPSNGPATASATLRGRLSKFARLIAMQVLATSPKFVDLHSIPSSVVEKERAIAEAAAATRTKGAPAPPPSSAAETKGTPFSKIAEQRLQRSLEEQCLLSQEFFMVKQLHEDVLRDSQAEAATDGRGGSCTSTARNQQQRQLTVADALQFVGQTLGCSLTVSRMRLISLGSQ